MRVPPPAPEPRRAPDTFDAIVAGGGHAGCEATLAMARLGLKVLLISSNLERIGYLSCNPSIGGVGKGNIVREIDSLGGMMGRWADAAGLQFRMLNTGAGPAVQAPRAQIDRKAYLGAVQQAIFGHPNIWVIQDFLAAPLLRRGRVSGTRTEFGREFSCRALLLALGTFVGGMLHIGKKRFPGGRLGDAPAGRIRRSLRDLGLSLDRFVTGTTPRLARDSVDFSSMEPQPADDPPPRFSFYGPPPPLPQLPCHLTWSTPESHQYIAENLLLSPLYDGSLTHPGPRYCLAIEDKVFLFPQRPRHQIFVEPEGVDSQEVYPNGIHTGMPLRIQKAFLSMVPGLERHHIIRPGYLVEYDYLPPTQLAPSLEVKAVPGLWSAGQLNGSSGYEEAAGQGLWAGLNIFCSLTGRPAFMPERRQAYLAVMVDDLTTKGIHEPYRMFTSRAEHRLSLRHSNADERLTPLGRELGLIPDADWRAHETRRGKKEKLLQELAAREVRPDAAGRAAFEELGESLPGKNISLAELLRRPGMNSAKIARLWPDIMEYDPECRNEAESALLYAGYLKREEELAARQSELELVRIGEVDYTQVHGLSREAVEKLAAVRPRTLGQAGRIPGVTPAALNCVEIHLKKTTTQRI
ncbi:MAG: tRNA uridine-5-carboxymethylaminomethyl(34) synthesis enzyme MnmG [Desulfovibrionaceae bacterium]|nr:tRNA uridine-5-carboxymethylaminomethyl(34) synthesis enzyme MnmG [Desulfovibrionaceae bacterium]